MSQPEERKAARMPMQKGHAGCPQDSEGLQGASHCYEKTRVRTPVRDEPLELQGGGAMLNRNGSKKAARKDGLLNLVGMTGFREACKAGVQWTAAC